MNNEELQHMAHVSSRENSYEEQGDAYPDGYVDGFQAAITLLAQSQGVSRYDFLDPLFPYKDFIADKYFLDQR